MASFADLPVEILVEILQYVLPEDLENFAQTCRKVTLVAQSRLKTHRQLVRKYGFCSSTSGRGQFLKNLLHEVLDQDCIARYIVRLDIGKLFETVFHIRQEESAFAKLLPLLHNLRTLSIEHHGYFNYLPPFTADAPDALALSLSKLLKVHLGLRPHRFYSSLKRLQVFISLPSLRLLSATSARSADLSGWGNYYANEPLFQQSYVKHLELRDCYINPAELNHFLQCFCHLESFYYSSPYDSTRNITFNPCLIRRGLLNSTATLRKMTIQAFGRTKAFIGSLSAFKVLKEIDTEWGFLGPVWGRDSGVIKYAWFPASLQAIRLRDGCNRGKSEYLKVFETLVLGKGPGTLQLKELSFKAPSTALSKNGILLLRRICNDAEIALYLC